MALGEPLDANALRVRNRLLMSLSYPQTAQWMEAHGLIPKLIDISEFTAPRAD